MSESIRERDNFYPRPPRGGRPYLRLKLTLSRRFLSTPSARRATLYSRRLINRPNSFLSTPSARRATRQLWLTHDGERISIHALREEGDVQAYCDALEAIQFLSTPSARRATDVGKMVEAAVKFLSTPSARRATDELQRYVREQAISIHALREEGDAGPCELCGAGHGISIHALREEGDGGAVEPRRAHRISIHALREEGDSKNRDKISIFKQIIQHSARI